MKILQILVLLSSLVFAKVSSNIVIVSITDDTLQKYGYSLSREVYANFINAIYKHYDPKVVSIDITIDLPNKADPKGDKKLFEAVKGKTNLIFAGLLSSFKINHQKYQPIQIDPKQIKYDIRKRLGAFLPLDDLFANGVYSGIFNASRRKDNYTVSFPFVYNIDGHYYPSLLLQNLLLYNNIYLDEFVLTQDTFNSSFLRIDYLFWGEVKPKLDYEFAHYSYEDILEHKADNKMVDGKIVLFDINATGVGHLFMLEEHSSVYSVEYLANVIETALQNEVLVEDFSFYIYGFLFMLFLIIGSIIYFFKKRK